MKSIGIFLVSIGSLIIGAFFFYLILPILWMAVWGYILIGLLYYVIGLVVSRVWKSELAMDSFTFVLPAMLGIFLQAASSGGYYKLLMIMGLLPLTYLIEIYRGVKKRREEPIQLND